MILIIKRKKYILCLPSGVFIALMQVAGWAKQIPETNTLNDTVLIVGLRGKPVGYLQTRFRI